MYKKRMIAGLMAFICVVGGYAVFNAVSKPDSVTHEITSYAIDSAIGAYASPNYTINFKKFTVGEKENAIGTIDDEFGVQSGDVWLNVYDVSVKDKDGNYVIGGEADKETKMPNNPVIAITKIDNGVFDFDVSSIEIPDSLKQWGDSVTGIVKGVFNGTYAKTVDLNGIKYLDSSVFSKAMYIEDVTIPDSVDYVGSNLFQGSGLKTLTIDANLMSIPEGMCSDTKLSQLTITNPSTVLSIGANAFKNTYLNKSLEYFSNGNLLYVEANAFSGCKNIQSLVIPDSVIFIEENVFQDCTSLKSLKMGTNLEAIDRGCFANCSALSSIEFNKKLDSLGGGVFQKCTSLVRVEDMPSTLKDREEIKADKDSDGVSAGEVLGYRGFCNEMFAGCTSLTYCELPPSLTYVPESCFDNCTALTDIAMPESITSVDKSAFRGCSNLKELYMKTIREVGDGAFEGCTNLVIPADDFSNMTSVGSKAFTKCMKLDEVNLTSCGELKDNAFADSSITFITINDNCELGKSVFENCKSLKSAHIPISVKELPNSLFNKCESLIDVNLDNCTVIGNSAFSECSSLETVDAPLCRVVNSSAFKNCKSLSKVTLYKEIKDIGSSAFENCESMKGSLSFKSPTIESSAFKNSSIEEITIEIDSASNSSVVGNSAFEGCKNLKKIELNKTSGDLTFGTDVFKDCTALTDVQFGYDVIPRDTFSGCTNITIVDTCGYDNIIVENKAFSNSGITYLSTNGQPNITTGKGIVTCSKIGDSAFEGTPNLVCIQADNSTAFEGNNQYRNSGVQYYYVSSKDNCIKQLTNNMFSGCVNLGKDLGLTDTIRIWSKTVDSIPGGCFAGCISLNDIDISGIKSIGEKAFYASGIEKFTPASGESTINVTVGKESFAECQALTEVSVQGVIDNKAFYNCDNLEKVYLSVSSIGSDAFSNCDLLREVSFGVGETAQKLTKIDSGAFNGCNLLMELYVPGNPQIGNNAIGKAGFNAIEGFELYGDSNNTSVKEYATKHEITYMDYDKSHMEARQEAKKTKGDVDGNGLITVADIVKMQTFVLQNNSKGCISANMDMNGDNRVDAFDIIELRSTVISKNATKD